MIYSTSEKTEVIKVLNNVSCTTSVCFFNSPSCLAAYPHSPQTWFFFLHWFTVLLRGTPFVVLRDSQGDATLSAATWLNCIVAIHGNPNIIFYKEKNNGNKARVTLRRLLRCPSDTVKVLQIPKTLDGLWPTELFLSYFWRLSASDHVPFHRRRSLCLRCRKLCWFSCRKRRFLPSFPRPPHGKSRYRRDLR